MKMYKKWRIELGMIINVTNWNRYEETLFKTINKSVGGRRIGGCLWRDGERDRPQPYHVTP